jgi:hypothetical protein
MSGRQCGCHRSDTPCDRYRRPILAGPGPNARSSTRPEAVINRSRADPCQAAQYHAAGCEEWKPATDVQCPPRSCALGDLRMNAHIRLSTAWVKDVCSAVHAGWVIDWMDWARLPAPQGRLQAWPDHRLRQLGSVRKATLLLPRRRHWWPDAGPSLVSPDRLRQAAIAGPDFVR